MKQVAYYKGCLASLSAKELDSSTQALAPKVGYELIELESVTCCGAGDIHEAEPDYYLHLNARILAYAAATGADTLMTVCNVCTLNLRQANYQLLNDAALRERVNDNLEKVGAPRYETDVDCVHFLWLVAGESFGKLQEVAHKGLRGLKIAPFYGCQILRPSKLMGFEDPDRPDSLERIIAACGGEAIDYPAKIKCCGFPIIQAREDTALAELIQPIEQAKEAGADAIVTPCPLCHLSLDAWQSKLKKQTGKDFQMPILHLSQLIGVAAGLEDSELRFKRHVVSMQPVLEKLALVVAPDGGTVPGRLEHPLGCLDAARRGRRRLPRAGSDRLRLAGGGMAPAARRRGRDPGASRCPRRDADRAPVRLPPRRRALAWQRRGERAARWVAERRPDLVCITGDLVSHPRGEALLRCAPRRARRTRSSCSVTTTSPSRAIRSRGPRSYGTSSARGFSGMRL